MAHDSAVCFVCYACCCLDNEMKTFCIKLTMAVAGWSGSSSANRWHWLPLKLPCLRATNPNILQEKRMKSAILHQGKIIQNSIQNKDFK